jgi:hypothetical protein
MQIIDAGVATGGAWKRFSCQLKRLFPTDRGDAYVNR